MQILLVRHGKTQGNLEGRYVGRTDEPLLESERARFINSGFGQYHPDIIYCSRMLRCRQTANLLFSQAEDCENGKILCDISRESSRTETEEIRHLPEVKIWEGLEETDFGEFEYKSYGELNGDSAYQAWIDSGGTLAFPGGESGKDFRKRCCRAFKECIQDAWGKRAECVAFVVHGGTIMSVMEAYAKPKADFYSWQVKNGDGFLLEFSGENVEGLSLSIIEKIGVPLIDQ